jgi:hypothetical protein
MKMPHGWAEVVEFYGDPTQYLTRRGEWERENIVSVRIPLALPIAGMPGKFRRSVRCHKKLADNVQRLFQAIKGAGFTGDQLIFGGDYNFRAKRGSGRLSMHTFGGAFDFNPQEFPLERHGDVANEQDPRLIDIFEAFGWNYGGYSHEGDTFTRDPMHFQAATGY